MIDMSGEDLIVQDIERDLAAAERKVAELSERRAELSIQLGQVVRGRDVLLRRLRSLRRIQTEPKGEVSS